ncbi:HlyD family efflux transporter periplasmic adaptor subunit [Flammeovirga yaeyamensis]|uniref:HlyD family efflux transporter periplasmic adaptor subunit n=1 Tax=Flammeovirga yaeyamensis TaxID=367791 RepID=A0AAX1N5L3_9BACT|nr:HlyD family secretion protein [Flammeovirga yaeyamensis]MBB3701195.1 multidrug resistance efflux pump [Flammeovirga yaeyamensis]NMF38479.1 HlyD family secretion protein [Flammeovirga yaeyamensis]QWG01661.1 HlyD family efflux transporter periplasmic adaptor subunit [Flammeovirga yaeyamensis]
MLDLILIVYGLIVWLVFIKFKLLAWNTTSKIIVFLIPVIGVTGVILTMNAIMPSSDDVRVYNKTVQIKANVRGRVDEVFVKENSRIAKGDTLFTIEQAPFKAQIEGIKASIEKARASVSVQYRNVDAIRANRKAVEAQLELARTRQAQFQELVDANAGNRFDLEQAQNNVKQLEAQLMQLKAQEASILATIKAEYNGEQVSVAELVARLERAEWDLEQTVVKAPIDATVVNLQLRKGAMALPLADLMTLVEGRQNIIASFDQNELHKMEEGNEVDLTFASKPGVIYNGKVESIVWASSRGQLLPSGMLPTIDQGVQKRGKYLVKLVSEEADIPMGANGSVAVYTSQTQPFYIIRKVMIRISAKVNYLILKAH